MTPATLSTRPRFYWRRARWLFDVSVCLSLCLFVTQSLSVRGLLQNGLTEQQTVFSVLLAWQRRGPSIQTTITPTRAHLAWQSLVNKWRKIGSELTHAKLTFLDAHTLGNEWRCSLKISQVVEHGEGLLMHTPLGKDLPNKFLHIKILSGFVEESH